MPMNFREVGDWPAPSEAKAKRSFSTGLLNAFCSRQPSSHGNSGAIRVGEDGPSFYSGIELDPDVRY